MIWIYNKWASKIIREMCPCAQLQRYEDVLVKWGYSSTLGGSEWSAPRLGRFTPRDALG